MQSASEPDRLFETDYANKFHCLLSTRASACTRGQHKSYLHANQIQARFAIKKKSSKKCWGVRGIEPLTSPTQTENHPTRPNPLFRPALAGLPGYEQSTSF